MAATAAELGQQRDRALVWAAIAALGSRVIAMIATVLTLAFAARALHVDQFGIVALLTTLAIFLGFGDFGLGTLLMTRLPAAIARGDQKGANELVTTTFNTLLRIGLVLVGGGVASAFFVPWQTVLGAHHLSASSIRFDMIAFWISGGWAIPSTLGSRVLAAMQRASVVYVWNAAAAVLSMVVTAVCAVEHAPVWVYVVGIAGGPTFLGTIQTVWVLGFKFPRLCPSTLHIEWRTMLATLKTGGLFAVMTVSAAVSYYIDGLVVSAVMGVAAAAVFTVAARLFSLVGGTISLAGQQMWSALSDAITRGDMAWVRSRYRRVLVISTAVNTAACVFLVVAGQELSRIWVGAKYIPPISLLIVSAIWTVYSTSVIQASYLLAAAERIKTVAMCGLIMTPINLGVSILLTKWYGLTGPLLGSIIAMALVFMIPIIVLTRRLMSDLEETHAATPVPDDVPYDQETDVEYDEPARPGQRGPRHRYRRGRPRRPSAFPPGLPVSTYLPPPITDWSVPQAGFAPNPIRTGRQ